MNKFRKEFRDVFIAKDTLLLRKTYFYYALVIAVVLVRIQFIMIHDIRLQYLMGLYQSIPRTHEINVAVLVADYGTRLSPTDVGAWVILAENLRQMGDLPGAAHAYQQAINLKPTSHKLRSALAEVYTELHQDQKAAEVLGL